jgi:hypothetical protein
LNNKLLMSVIKFASKFSKSEADRQAVPLAMQEEKAYTSLDVKNEQEDKGLFTEYQGKAVKLNEGVDALAAKENQ